MFAIAVLATYVNVDMQPNRIVEDEIEQIDETSSEENEAPVQ